MRWVTLISVAVIAVLAIPVQAAAADDELLLEPSDAWNIRYDEDKCRLLRSFGSGDDQTLLQIDQTGTEPFYTLALFGRPLDETRGTTMSIQFGPHEGASERSFLAGRLQDEDIPFIIMHGIHLAPVPSNMKIGTFVAVDIGAAREAAIDRIVLDRGLHKRLVLHTGSLGEPLSAMRTCSQDLAKHLGLDSEGQASLSRRAEVINAGEVARRIPYPPEMIRRDTEGEVDFRVIVNEHGKATTCQIARSTRPAVFDDIVCHTIMRLAEFEPALDREGNPTASYYESRVRFEIPKASVRRP